MPDAPLEFRYLPPSIDGPCGTVACRYDDGTRTFVEQIGVGARGTWSPAAESAARLVHLLAGVSYYKATAAPVIDLTNLDGVGPGEAAFLRHFVVEGLGEFAYRNDLDLRRITVRHRPPDSTRQTRQPAVVDQTADPRRPLIPFGGGLDSIVTVELLAGRFPDAALFILNRPGDRFAAIETAAEVTGLPIVRAERELDEQILRSADLGLLNGHVPITGVLSAVAVLAATHRGYDAVVMSNEHSASAGNVVLGGRQINHQWSKSLDFEERFAALVDRALGGTVRYFSELRAYSELWIARQFAHLDRYHLAFRSCNRAFAQDPARRLDRWCGHCDKCCFIDLILAPFLAVERLEEIFSGAEPLGDPGLVDRFRALVALSPDLKPWECVGDVDECRAALVLAAGRPDRADNPLIGRLMGELGPAAAPARGAVANLLTPQGRHHVPNAFAPAPILG
jgi:hypothetical protein